MSNDPARENEFLPEQDDAEEDELLIDVTEDGFVWVHSEEIDLLLDPDEARQFAQALLEAADEAEEPVVGDD